MKRRKVLAIGAILLLFLPFQNCGQSFQVNQAGSADIASSSSLDEGSSTPTSNVSTTTLVPCLSSEVGVPTLEQSPVSTATVLSGRGNRVSTGRVDSAPLTLKYIASNSASHCAQAVNVECSVVSKSVTAMNRTGARSPITSNNDLRCTRTQTVSPGQTISVSFSANDDDDQKQCFSGTVTYQVGLTSTADNSKKSPRQQFTVTYKDNCYPETIANEKVDSYDNLGASVAMDGNTLAVLAPGDDGETNSTSSVGAIYIYRRNGNDWTKSQVLRATDTPIVADRGGNGEYPNSLSLKNGLLVVGAALSNSSQGAVYIYRDLSGNFSQVAKLTGPISNSGFGSSVSTDGVRIVVGAAKENADKGAVYIYSGSSFETLQKISSPATHRAAFGQAVAIDSNLLVIGAPGASLYKDETVGGVYFYNLGIKTAGQWDNVKGPLDSINTSATINVKTQSNVNATLTLPAGSELGASLSIYNGRVVVGAPGYSVKAVNVGIALIVGSDLTSLQSLQNPSGDLARFGASVAMGSSGIFVALPEYSSKRGAIDHFTDASSYFKFSRRITSKTGVDSDEFGSGVATSGNFFAVGARNEGPNHSEGNVSILTPVIP